LRIIFIVSEELEELERKESLYRFLLKNLPKWLRILLKFCMKQNKKFLLLLKTSQLEISEGVEGVVEDTEDEVAEGVVDDIIN
jgi:hypothetical protein